LSATKQAESHFSAAKINQELCDTHTGSEKMALQAEPWEFDEDAPNPNEPMLKHNEAVRNNIEMIAALKESIATGEDDFAAQLWQEAGEALRDILWIAPSKGGILSTKERSYIQSHEFSEALKRYIADNK
jgi:hypothetical protein